VNNTCIPSSVYEYTLTDGRSLKYLVWYPVADDVEYWNGFLFSFCQ